MVKIREQGASWLIENTFVYGTEADAKRISLMLTKGEAVQYGETATRVVDFPGEYDIDSVAIKVSSIGDKLYFVVTFNDKRYALLQDKDVLEAENMENIDIWICTDQSIKEAIENLELDGEIVILGDDSAE